MFAGDNLPSRPLTNKGEWARKIRSEKKKSKFFFSWKKVCLKKFAGPRFCSKTIFFLERKKSLFGPLLAFDANNMLQSVPESRTIRFFFNCRFPGKKNSLFFVIFRKKRCFRFDLQYFDTVVLQNWTLHGGRSSRVLSRWSRFKSRWSYKFGTGQKLWTLNQKACVALWPRKTKSV